jgi:hypothetical protein
MASYQTCRLVAQTKGRCPILGHGIRLGERGVVNTANELLSTVERAEVVLLHQPAAVLPCGGQTQEDPVLDRGLGPADNFDRIRSLPFSSDSGAAAPI